ncbi:hypothetical protein K458DRAFT_380656 [Lentithecium fluviatile CBS 122367]|uniref:Peptidase S33 tripeptidyl aminopeptidase-like C-terminal domain-containing protein n=1 Tax=Lentithecium fluviatile CBS 122367 TaxID=1168545 RepID=A0A6G1IDD6_9PLEO|nr:hypothetical protein K458DRAFT_380656 [Lentithecium fluviatile CBS 122367]
MGRVLLPVTFLAASAAAYPSIFKRQNETQDGGVDSFDSITPSEQLAWQPCFGEFKCTSLTVPLDYANPSVGTTNVAFIKYEFANSTGQSILFNPGGPGASGVVGLIGLVGEFTATFGTDYNFVSFDPRGVNNTGPAISCSNSVQHNPSLPLVEQWAQAQANGEICTAANNGTNASYAGTSAVVQDMMHFTELEAAACGKDPAEAKIWYYGVSYGTVLGQTLAAMYPNRLGRIILDANVYGVEHYQGFVPSAAEETDDAFGFFFNYCYEAGPELCPLAGNATSAVAIEQRYQAFLKKLEQEPLVIKGDPQGTVITRNLMANVAFKAMYVPRQGFYALARAIVGLEKGDTSETPVVSKLIGLSAEIADVLPSETDVEPAPATRDDGLQLITCIDTAGRYALKSSQDYVNAVRGVESDSVYGLPITANFLLCTGLNIAPPASQFFPGFASIQTSVPILFVGTTGDPVTPLSSAHKMSEYFPGSAVLTQVAPGHSFLAVPSECTLGHVRAYMKDAALPEAGTQCDVGSQGGMVFEAGKEAFESVLGSLAGGEAQSKVKRWFV